MRARAAPLRLIHDRRDTVEHGIAAVAIKQLQKAPFAGFQCRDLRPKIAHRPIWKADIHSDQVDEILIDDARPSDTSGSGSAVPRNKYPS